MARMYVCAYNRWMVSWDPEKAASNLEKHGVDFADAALVLEDDMALTQPDAEHDDRWVSLGADAFNRILVVVYAWEDDEPRLISARRATGRERRQYEGK